MKRETYCGAAGAAWGKRCLTLCVFLLTASLAFGGSSKLSKDLQNLPSGQSANVIVQYYKTPTTTDTSAATSAGATKLKKLGSFKGHGYSMSPAAAAKLASLNTNVKYISPDRPLKGAMNFAVPAVNADLAHNLGYDGTGVGVAVIDSGVNSVADLGVSGSSSSRVVYSQNFDP